MNTKSVLGRTLDNLAMGWKRISQFGSSGNLRLRAGLPDNERNRLKLLIQDCLESKGGEVSTRARAADLGQAYLQLNDEGRYRFLRLIVNDFGIDRAQLKSSAKAYLEHPDDPDSLEKMKMDIRPPWIKLFTQFNALPSGIKFLVDMRADMLRYSKTGHDLEPLNRDLQSLLISWFDIGFLDLKRITWNEPAALLEKLIEYEAVHEIQSWDDLKNRLDVDRCCYAFFHPRMPDEPLIFVQVALVNGLSEKIDTLLDDTAPAENPDIMDTAVFYSITNTQLGLRGISLGDFLIKRVVDDLTKNFPNLKTFSTLSPIPGFGGYLREILENGQSDSIDDGDKKILNALLADKSGENLEAAKSLLMRLCAHYLVNVKRGRRAKDSVANFHLSNGARLEQINWLGDLSESGMERSCGLMVNYLYKLPDIEKNHEGYAGNGEIMHSSSVKSLLKKH